MTEENTAAPSRARVGGTLLLLGATALGVTLLAVKLPRIPQPKSYHRFADQRLILGIPHGLNVLSNLPLVAIGAAGILRVLRSEAAFVENREKAPYLAFFTAMGLTGIGSAYYHLWPNHARLVLDRAPLGAAVGALLAAVITDRVGPELGTKATAPLVVLGGGSAVHWYATEVRGKGDLRAYAIARVYPFLAIPILMLGYPSRYTRGGLVWRALLEYQIAKVCEVLDAPIYRWTRKTVSGHTLKHLFAAMAGIWIWKMLGERRPSPS